MDIGAVFHVILTAVVFVTMLSLLVAAHEYGHYLFARLFGMGVEEFAIGFGRKKVVTWMRRSYDVDSVDGPAGETNGTTYMTDGSSALQVDPSPTPSSTKLTLRETTDFTIRPWPLGGFVRIKGMVPEEDGSETKVPGGFYSKAPWKRFFVLLAGPVFSVLAGVIILTGVHWSVGMQKPLSDPVLGPMSSDGAAAKAGLKPGDRILSVNGEPVSKFYDIVRGVLDRSGEKVVFEYERGGKTAKATVVPVKRYDPVLAEDLISTLPAREAGRIGIQPDSKLQNVSFSEAATEALMTPYVLVKRTVAMFAKPSEIKDNVGGPLSIVQATSDATKKGLDFVVWLAAMLSISVGIFNLFPIPPLDGGQMLVAIAEMLRGGKRLSIKVQGAIAAVGFTLIIAMFVSIMYIDVGRLTNPQPSKVLQKQDK